VTNPPAARNPSAPAGALLHLDPHSLIIGANVRDNATDGQQFTDLVDSIREHGVLVALTAVQAGEGTVTVREGQRRTLAAREAGAETVPVYVVPDTAETDQARTVSRITQQIIANDHRVPLTESQRAQGIQQLLIEGLSPTKVAKRLTVLRTLVDAAAIAVKSAGAMAALGTTQLSIEQASVLAQFDADPQAVQYLSESATPGEFDHRVSELHEKAATAAAREAVAAPLRDKGFQMLDEKPRWADELDAASLSRLCDSAGEEPPDNNIVDERPDLWAVFLEEVEAYIDTRTGEEIDYHSIDWDLEVDDPGEPEAGYLHPKYVEVRAIFDALYYCLDVGQIGLMTRTDYYQSRSRGVHNTIGGEDDALARQEAERRDRRKVVALNKLGLAALKVRQLWIRDHLLARKTAPQGASIFIAHQLSDQPSLLSVPNALPMAHQLLGLAEGDSIIGHVNDLTASGDPRATVITLGLVIGALESQTPKDAWRRRYNQHSRDLVVFLETHGYEPSDIERVITGATTADSLYDRIAAEAAHAKEKA
jgi:ParB family chromosome partitioning protein